MDSAKKKKNLMEFIVNNFYEIIAKSYTGLEIIFLQDHGSFLRARTRVSRHKKCVQYLFGCADLLLTM